MDIIISGFLICLSGGLGTVAVWMWRRYETLREQHEQKTLELEQLRISSALHLRDVDELRARVREHQEEVEELLVSRAQAQTSLASLSLHYEKLEKENRQLLQLKEQAVEEKNRYQRLEELARQRISTIEQEMQNWEKTKEQHIEIAKASVMAAGNQLSSKLLDDHKREAENAKKENEKLVQETTEGLHKKFQSVFESMSTLHDRVNSSSQIVDVVQRALLSPSGSGELAEITLENIFKNSGLIDGQDYRMQHWIPTAEGRGLKPDAVVFLPGDNVMAIDSKASKFFFEMEKDNNPQSEQALRTTMMQHVKDLTARNYAEAIVKETGASAPMILMFLQTDSALEKLHRIDPKFHEEALKKNIILVGPSGLKHVLLLSKMFISEAKQEKNAQEILAEVKDLLSSVIKLHDLAGAMGRSIKSSLGAYDKFAGSFDRTFMSKAKRIEKLGAQSPALRDLKKLERYTVGVTEVIETDFFEEESANANDSEPKKLSA